MINRLSVFIITILGLSHLLVFGQINNGGFEVWDTTYTNAYSDILLNEFGIPEPLGGIAHDWVSSSGFGLSRTTDSYEGDYALILHNWYNYAFEWINYDDTISSRPQFLQGYFKYTTGGIDGLSQGAATVALTRFNGLSSDTIAAGSYTFDSTADFTLFEIPLNYFSGLTPDSIHIYFINGDQPCDMDVVCNFLYLDDLTLSDFSSGTSTAIKTDLIAKIYPNPTSGELNIETFSEVPIYFSLYNSLGEKIANKLKVERVGVINVSAFAPGIYFYKLDSNNRTRMGCIIKN